MPVRTITLKGKMNLCPILSLLAECNLTPQFDVRCKQTLTVPFIKKAVVPCSDITVIDLAFTINH